MKPTNLRLWCLVVLCVALFAVNSTARPIDFSELDRVVPEELKATNTPGAVIVVVSGNQVVYQKAFGIANVETNALLQPEMLFGVRRSWRLQSWLRFDDSDGAVAEVCRDCVDEQERRDDEEESE